MRLIIIGCEYAGKTALAEGIRRWIEQNMGHCSSSFHDHFFPWDPADSGSKSERIEEDLKLLTLDDPILLEKYARYVIHYHTHPGFYAGPDHCVVNWYYGDAVYGPLYYGFGGSTWHQMFHRRLRPLPWHPSARPLAGAHYLWACRSAQRN